jgi:predicted deacetylase
LKIAIRDDDTCYFTEPEALERVYEDVWDRVPVCLAVVPFAIGYKRTGIPEAHWSDGREFPLDRNAALVDRLRGLVTGRRVGIALHGYTHQDFSDGFEFQAAPDPLRRVREGRAYLQQVLGTTVSIFVPPHNALSAAGLDAVRQEGLNLLGSFLSFHPRHRAWEWRTPVNWWRVSRYRARTGRSRHDAFVFPYVLRYGHHSEFGCHSVVPGTTFQRLTAAFEEARSAGGHFCLAAHYWELDETLKDVMRRFIDYAGRYADVEFVPAEALFAR